MNPKAKGSPCYYCGEPSIGVEHIPPEQLFVCVKVSEITVPSCELHNGLKSKFDEAVIKGFLYSIHEYLETKQMKPEDVHPSVHALIEKVKHRFPQVKNLVTRTNMFRPGEDPRGRDLTAVSMDERLDYQDWIKKLTAGLIWDATRKFHKELDWVEQSIVIDNFYAHVSDRNKGMTWDEMVEFHNYAEKQVSTLEKIKWYEGWSAYPKPYPAELYNFKLTYIGASGNLWFKHTFLGTYSFYVQIKCPEHIALRIGLHNDLIELSPEYATGKIPLVMPDPAPNTTPASGSFF